MQIARDHPVVDLNGVCRIPKWTEKSSLVVLLEDLRALFSTHPPVHSIPTPLVDVDDDVDPVQPEPLLIDEKPPLDLLLDLSSPLPVAVAKDVPISIELPVPPEPEDEAEREDLINFLTHRIKAESEVFGAKTTELIDGLFADQSALVANMDALKSQQLQLRQQFVCSTPLSISPQSANDEKALESVSKLDELDAWIEKHSTLPPLSNDIDGYDDPLGSQLIDLIALDASLEDSIYYLARGLSAGVLPLNDHLRDMRRLTRNQFMARALAKKVEEARIQAGLQACQEPPPQPPPVKPKAKKEDGWEIVRSEEVVMYPRAWR